MLLEFQEQIPHHVHPFVANNLDGIEYIDILDLQKSLKFGVIEFAHTRLHVLRDEKINELQLPSTSKKELKPFIIDVLELMNQTFEEIYGFVPLNDREKIDFAARYLPVLDPKFVKLIQTGGKLVGFAVGMPDFSRGIREAKGKLFPFGIFKILKESKRSRKLLMMLGGVKKEFRGKGLEVLMGVKILQSGIKHKMDTLDSHLVLEDNIKMRAEYERIGCQVVKKFRIYQKEL